MSLFDQLVSEALKNQAMLAPIRMVVEKELLHHDIIREMNAAGLLQGLTFMGGTCLRACYGSNRLSEDLDFTGGQGFRRGNLRELGDALVERLQTKYGLHVEVGDPIRDSGNVDTWKLRMITHPEQKHMPQQRINIDICAIPSYDRRPMVLRNHYGVDMGTQGLIIQAQSRAEILADKLVALALRPNRLKYRDIWDIGWLKQQNVELPLELMPKKIKDHRSDIPGYLDLLHQRLQQLQHDPGLRLDFVSEMRRFLPPRVVIETIDKETYWHYLVDTVIAEGEAIFGRLDKK